MFEIPPELIADIEAFETSMGGRLIFVIGFGEMPDQISRGMSEQRFGDLPRWRAAIAALPSLQAEVIDLDTSAITASGAVIAAEGIIELETALRGLHPWRKGPFSLFGVDIDTEWRSDFKWDRLAHCHRFSGGSPRARRRLWKRLPLLADERCRGRVRSLALIQHRYSFCSSKRFSIT